MSKFVPTCKVPRVKDDNNIINMCLFIPKFRGLFLPNLIIYVVMISIVSCQSVSKELSKELGQSWKDVGRSLKISDPELENLEMNHKGQREIAYQMLLKWKRKAALAATYEVLSDALDDAGRADLKDTILEKK